MIKKIIKSILPIIFFSSIMLIEGIYGAFNYARCQANDALDQIVNIEIVDFNYETHTTYFPNTTDGKINEDLINNLINGNDNVSGLNDPNSKLNDLIANQREDKYGGEYEIIGTMDYFAGDYLSSFLSDSEANITFIINFPEESYPDIYYIYSTTTESMFNFERDYEEISPVYRTTLVRQTDGTYKIEKVEEGKTVGGYIYCVYGTSPFITTYYNYTFNYEKWTPISN